jgi:mono/diheme cytochrome c family protein
MIRSIALAAVLGLGATAVSAEEATLTAAQLFASTCGFCHQDGGRVAGRGPKLAGTDRPDEYLLNRIRLGKEGAMPAYGRAFSDVQLRALVAYIRSLKDDAR